MADNDTLPVSRYSPVSGVFVDRRGNTVAINGRLELFGPEATAARAGSVAHWINKTWTARFPDGHSISCRVTVAYRAPGTSKGAAGQVEAVKISGPSHYSPIWKSITLNANEADAFRWTAAHEFGHMIGLKDRYSESIMSKLAGAFGGKRTTTVNPGYAGNVMAVDGGRMESKNVRDLVKENAPSWFDTDNRVRAWVSHHKLSDITQLSTDSKIKMIKTLMSGYIHDTDVAAIVRICDSVVNKDEAKKIRKAVDLTDFSSLGQRMTVRIAMHNMPK